MAKHSSKSKKHASKTSKPYSHGVHKKIPSHEPKSKISEIYEKNMTWDVEKILEEVRENGETLFHVKWKNWASKHNTWEPESNLNCPDLIKEYRRTKAKLEKKSNIVEKIVGEKIEDGKTLFLVKWKHWSEKFNTWEPPIHLKNHQALIDKFRRNVAKKASSDGSKKATEPQISQDRSSTPAPQKTQSRSNTPAPKKIQSRSNTPAPSEESSRRKSEKITKPETPSAQPNARASTSQEVKKVEFQEAPKSSDQLNQSKSKRGRPRSIQRVSEKAGNDLTDAEESNLSLSMSLNGTSENAEGHPTTSRTSRARSQSQEPVARRTILKSSLNYSSKSVKESPATSRTSRSLSRSREPVLGRPATPSGLKNNSENSSLNGATEEVEERSATSRNSRARSKSREPVVGRPTPLRELESNSTSPSPSFSLGRNSKGTPALDDNEEEFNFELLDDDENDDGMRRKSKTKNLKRTRDSMKSSEEKENEVAQKDDCRKRLRVSELRKDDLNSITPVEIISAEQDGQSLKFEIKVKNSKNSVTVDSEAFKAKYPQLVIDFYEKRLTWRRAEKCFGNRCKYSESR